MSEALGLSIGTTNLAAARPGRMPVSRRSVLTLWDNRLPEVGVPSQNPELTSPNLTAPGVVLRGFVERVGDPVPLVAADGSAHRGEALLATALDAMARAVDDGSPASTVMVATPAYWGPAAIGALRGALRASAMLAPGGVPPMIISDATAGFAALQANPGLPTRGVVALCDFGGSGSSITLADAGANLAPIGETLRFTEFSGDQIDQALLNHVLAGARSAGADDTSGTAAVGPLTRLREECRLAKERLSAETTTLVPVELPGTRSEIRVTRAELESVIAPSLDAFLGAVGDALEHNRIPAASLAAVATVGGGAAIPVISQRLSETLRVPVVTSPRPDLTVAAGVALLAALLLAPVVFYIVRSVTTTLRDATNELREGAEQVVSASTQVSRSAQSLSQGATEQAASLEETSASMEEMASMTRQNAENSQRAAELMSEADRRVAESNKALESMVGAMGSIRESSQKVAKIIKTIDEIAFQTNILALNAAVEAARAGEAGMGFAVVADEVRNLAQRSAQAAKDTTGLIEEATRNASQGMTKLREVSEAFTNITDSVGRVKGIVTQVSEATRQQSQGIDQVSQAVAQMESVTQATAASAEESAAASEELSAQTEVSKELVEGLRVLVVGHKDQGQPVRPARAARPTLVKSDRQPAKSAAPASAPNANEEGEDFFKSTGTFGSF